MKRARDKVPIQFCAAGYPKSKRRMRMFLYFEKRANSHTHMHLWMVYDAQ